MRKKLAVCMLLAGLGAWGNQSSWAGKFMSQASQAQPEGGVHYVSEVPNMVGPYGQPVEARGPAVVKEPTGADYARAAILQGYPDELLRQGRLPQGTGAVVSPGSGVQQTQFMAPQMPGMPPMGPGMMPGGVCGPGGCPPGGPGGPGGMPGGPGGMNPMFQGQPGVAPPGPPGAVAALGALTGQAAPFGVARTEIRFVRPAGMKVSWYAPRTDGRPGFSTQYLEAPARYNFLQASVYRLKLSDIPNRPGVDLYPTLEVPPATLKTATFLAHSSVPIAFTEEDFEQVAAGNFVVKVIYLPDPQFQDLAATGPDEVVSSRLEPGADPILEAKRRGTILAIIRLGNIDLEAPNTPAMDAPDTNQVRAYQMQQQQHQAMMQQMAALRQRMAAGKQPNLSGMVPPGVDPGMLPPGITTPVNTDPGTPSAPTVPTPLPPGTSPSGSPLGRLPTAGSIVPVGYQRPGTGR